MSDILNFVADALAGSIIDMLVAQKSRGEIGGRVTDPQGNGVPKVKVSITNADSGVTLRSVTNDQGAYSEPCSCQALGLVVGSKELAELPTTHGNRYALISLAAGTTFEGNPLLNRPYEPTHIVSYSMAAASPEPPTSRSTASPTRRHGQYQPEIRRQ